MDVCENVPTQQPSRIRMKMRIVSDAQGSPILVGVYSIREAAALFRLNWITLWGNG